MEKSYPLADLLQDSVREAVGEVLRDCRVAMISCMLWRNESPWALRARRLGDSFLLIPVKGVLRVELGKERRDLVPGQFLMLPPGREHVLSAPLEVRQLHQLSLHCHIRQRDGGHLLSRFASPFQKFSDPGEWFGRFSRLTHLMGRDPALGQVYGESAMKLLLADLLCSGATLNPEAENGDVRLRSAVHALLERPGAALRVRDLARACGLGEVQFRKLFRRGYGMAPHAFQARLRMEQAVQLLSQTEQSIKQVALASGFTSPQYFQKCFRHLHGITPLQYRRGRGREV